MKNSDIGGGRRGSDRIASDLLGNINHETYLQDLLAQLTQDFYSYISRPRLLFLFCCAKFYIVIYLI
jgi:hypothetical protein